MESALFVVVLLVGVLAGAALAGRIGVPTPLLLIVAGVAVSYLPGVPEVHLEPEVVLLGLLPPLLYATAVQTSLVDFARNRRTILLLSIGLVAFTTLGVGVVVHALLPAIGWPAAFAIGAVVAPPDAVAATAIGRRIGLPRRLVTILEGESLLNDATALVALRTAVAAIGAGVTAWQVAGDFLLAAGGGALAGFVTFKVVAWFRPRITDPVLDTAVSFVVPFVAYLAAEAVHASGVLAVVVAGLLLGHKAPLLQTAKSRVTERTNWRTLAFVLENAVFALIGLQAKWIIGDVVRSGVPLGLVLGVCLATLGAVIVLRLAWVFPARYLLIRPRDLASGEKPPAANTFVLGWAGMRGVVTLAAAFVIPTQTPYREVLLLAAFTVVAGTLLIQGLSLPWLVRRLRVRSPDPREDALARATLLDQASAAAEERLAELEFDDPHGVRDLIRQRSEQRNFAAWERLDTVAEQETPSELYARVRTELLAAERERVLQIRSLGQVPSEVVADVLATLDLEESMIDDAQPERTDAPAPAGVHRTGEGCADLDRYPVAAIEPARACPECLAEGLTWVALRQCLECGHVGCCDSSPGRHATAHFRATTHPVMQSAQPGEDWRWCYVHHTTG
ncbi:Na+/H+ antiporter [Propionicimonas sp.]|uniref:Na+/H+ antiporter n=1 Tax=Propionicimonas sp. TaxID=1955623 RepID=UPI0039E3449C